MSFNEVWDETDPDGDTTTISKLDDQDRLIKRAVRERLEGDPANVNSGIYESGSFGTTCIVKAGSARGYAVAESQIGSLTQQDGRLAFTTDTGKLFHLASSGIQEVNYLNLNGSRAMAANLPMGGHNITGLAKATAADHAVRFDQLGSTAKAVVLTSSVNTLSGLNNWNNTALSFAVNSGETWVVHYGLFFFSVAGGLDFRMINSGGSLSNNRMIYLGNVSDNTNVRNADVDGNNIGSVGYFDGQGMCLIDASFTAVGSGNIVLQISNDVADSGVRGLNLGSSLSAVKVG